jgi:uncharacterized membrane protein
MIQRCNNPNTTQWKDWGGRGIKVCKRWRLYKNFLADMGEVPKDMQIDRIDNNGDYKPSNCRWVDSLTQNRNRAYTIKVNGKTIVELATEQGIKPMTLYMRLRRARKGR